MNTNSNLIKLIEEGDMKGVACLIQGSTLSIAEAMTGFLASDLNNRKLMAGRLVQSALNFKLLTQLGREIKELRDNGKIKEDYFATHNEQATLVELLKFIEEKSPDEEVFDAIKKIFFMSISIDASERDSILAHELLKICKKLESGEILILRYCYNRKSENSGSSADAWVSSVSNGLNLPSSMIELWEENLIKLKLISVRVYSDNTGVRTGEHYRLTEFGLKFCEFITKDFT